MRDNSPHNDWSKERFNPDDEGNGFAALPSVVPTRLGQIDRVDRALDAVLEDEASNSPALRNAFEAYNNLKSILDRGLPRECECREVQSLFFDRLDASTRETVAKLFLMRTELHEAALKSVAFREFETEDYRNNLAEIVSTDRLVGREPNSVQFHLGILGKETEPLNLSQVKALSEVSEILHTETADADKLRMAVHKLWTASHSGTKDSETEIQLYYATQIYRSFAGANARINDVLKRAGSSEVAPTGWLNLFTWLRGDVDGRPYETTKDTEQLLEDLRAHIFGLYHDDVTNLAKDLPDPTKAGGILARLNPDGPEAYSDPACLINDIRDLFGVTESCELTDRIAAFGLHFVRIELRQNSHAIALAVDELLPPELIGQQLLIPPIRYLELTNPQRMRLLTQLQLDHDQDWPQQLYGAFKTRTDRYLQSKAQQYAQDSYFSMASRDPDYAHLLDVANCFERVLLAARFPETVRLHGIAETGCAADVLALLFVNTAVGNKYGLDIAMQPEDPTGAITLLSEVEQVYENPIYRDHLTHRGDIQYLTCGPSDTGKSGGKPMHKANALIASRHRDIAKKFGIELVVHPIIGYEHSRGNGPFADIVKEYDAISSSHTRFTMAGLREMRSQFGAHAHTSHALSDMFLAHLQSPVSNVRSEKAKEVGIAEWFGGIEAYERLYFLHPNLPDFLKRAARFDVLSFAWKGQRPLARDRDIPVEEDPPAIRAIPFSRAMMMGGIFAEGLGGSFLRRYSPEEIRSRARSDRPFGDYLKSLAYAVSRCDLDHAWRTIGMQAPTEETREMWAAMAHEDDQGHDAARNLLAAIHSEVETIRNILSAVYPGGTGQYPLLSQWPHLAREVAFRERSLRLPKYLFEIGRVEESRFTPQLVKDLSAMYISLVNTAVSFVYTGRVR